MNATITKVSIEKQIKELEATPATLVGSDEGTHGGPLTHNVYMTIEGVRFVTRNHGGRTLSNCTEEQAARDTEGRMRLFHAASQAMAEKIGKLRLLRKQLRDASK